jgi:hypothetical protein
MTEASRAPAGSATLGQAQVRQHSRTREALFPEGGLNVLMGTIHADLWGARRGSLQG